MRPIDLIVPVRALWYKIGAILFIALIITAVAFRIVQAMQQDPPPNAETFASESKCKANNRDEHSDEHGCYPNKGEGWCAAKRACINRSESDLLDDEAFSKHCSVQSKGKETNTDPVLADDLVDSSKSDTCCMSGKVEEETTPPTPPSNKSSCDTCAKPQPECPKSECPKPVYCPPCPKCPPPCPRMCPDLSKYVLKTSIPPCPEPKVDKDIYMLKSECKQPDMSKYVLKTSVPSFKSTPCPPCICKCDGYTPDHTSDEIDTSGSVDVPIEEALGGQRDQSEDSAAFEDSSNTAPIETDSPSESSQLSSKFNSSVLGDSGGIEGNVLGHGGLAQSSAQADFQGTCHADSQLVNGYSIQPVIEK